MALALAMQYAKVGVALLVDSAFVSTGDAARQRMLQQYRAAGVLAFITHPNMTCMWICTFTAPGHLSRILHSGLGQKRPRSQLDPTPPIP
jgi:hypothetical protein